MASGDTALFSGNTSQAQPTAVDWETDYIGSPVVPKTANFDINEGDEPPTVAKSLADAFNSRNAPSFCATATGAKVVFTAEDPKYKVSDMEFTINNERTPIPGNGPSVPLGKTTLRVQNTNGQNKR